VLSLVARRGFSRWRQSANDHPHCGWQLEAIAFAYQFSFLVLTPLVTVILWLALDPGFLKRMLQSDDMSSGTPLS
jgi:hypothetical protein